jgi:hypothetical protein
MAKKTEKADGSASGDALFKEEIPSKLHIADVWINEKKTAPKHGRQLEAACETETAAQGGTLMGRLAERMASRDMIDELNLGPKGTTGATKKAQIADNFEDEIPTKMMLGAGLHIQTKDKKASNFSNPIPEGKVLPGSNMADQAKAAGNVFDTMHTKKKVNTADFGVNDEDEEPEEIRFKHGDEPDSNFNPEQLKMGIKSEMEHTEHEDIAKQIAKAHLVEIPDYYTRLEKMEREAKR